MLPGFPSYGKDKGHLATALVHIPGGLSQATWTPRIFRLPELGLHKSISARQPPGPGSSGTRAGGCPPPGTRLLKLRDTQWVGGGAERSASSSCHSPRGSLVTEFAELVCRSCHREEVPWVDQEQKTSQTETEEKQGLSSFALPFDFNSVICCHLGRFGWRAFILVLAPRLSPLGGTKGRV